METIEFYNFDITSGSEIQAGALFDIFDDLASIVTSKRALGNQISGRSNQFDNRKSKKKGYP
ncbi:MAG: hypothetical protein AB9897_03475 [Anaerolineaceae bacterium]